MEELKELIAVSLWYNPCNVDQLSKRDFFKNRSLYGIELLLQQMENSNIIYYTGQKYKVYKQFINSNRMKKYEISTD